MKNENIRVKNVVQSSGCDYMLPFALTYLVYIILHGHLSPGGGFQGGVLIAAVIALLAMAYGYEAAGSTISFGLVHHGEGLASVCYVALAFMGAAVGAQFCQNILYTHGAIGDLYSSGTIFWMNVTVGVKVFTGISSVCLLMLGVLRDIDEKGRDCK
jgi:multicomponent Na+:H+ antiporter subunit B